MEPVFKGDIGVEISLECGVDLGSATTRKIFAKKPSGEVVEWTATADGSTSIKYVTQSGDLDEVGNWEIQSYIVMTGWDGRGEVEILEVLDHLGTATP